MQHYTVNISNNVNLYQAKTQKVVDFRKFMRFEVAAEDAAAAIKRFVPYMDMGDNFNVTTRIETGRFDRDTYPIQRDYVHLAGRLDTVKYHPQRRQLTITRQADAPATDMQIAL